MMGCPTIFKPFIVNGPMPGKAANWQLSESAGVEPTKYPPFRALHVRLIVEYP